MAALPVGLDEAGLPLGVLVCARPGADLACLGVAGALAGVLPGMRTPR
jgi:Asp-tRNA(Asn)/Glu-tRNA(Gln) amidotransferase A subunit family amidase